MERKARLYIGFIVTAGAFCAYSASWQGHNGARFTAYLLLCIVTSVMKVRLPGILTTLSVNFLFILIGILDMSCAETIMIGSAGAIVQCVWKPRNPIRPVQALFSVANITVAIFGASYLYHLPLMERLGTDMPLAAILASLTFFVLNTAGVAGVVSLTEHKNLIATWKKCYFWSFPFYLVGAVIAWVFKVLSQYGHGESRLLLLPVIYLIYRSYKIYLSHLEDEKKHVEDMAALHLRTIEELALAIDAKDHTTHEHLNRVRTYAVEIGKEMGLPQPELDALRAAALLHDIGKLAVPEHIISKPGKLTPEEFEKMKIHPLVGMEILQRVEFPYPVAPIVRSHHERWDGSGYPDGLKGEQIPIGARILAAVDALDALASDRQYRRALSPDAAMEEISRLSGKSFDPAVIQVLQRKYAALWHHAADQPAKMTCLSTEVRVTHGDAPAAGFEVSEPVSTATRRQCEFVTSIAAARQEVQLLFELTQDLGTSLSLDETISLVAARLKPMIPYDAIAVYFLRDGRLIPGYVNGVGFGVLSSLKIPVGEGLSGWVARTGRPILNGNPAVECSYLLVPAELASLRSALAVPLVGVTGNIGVMTLYRTEKDAFSADHVRVLLAITSKVSLAIDNALKFRQAETSATTDFLTTLPNARSLFLRLEAELARCKRLNEPLTLMVCDLDGFKQVNDRHGHIVGNNLLRAVGAALRESCREYDYVSRMGGDEFVLILPNSDREATRDRIAQLREIGARAGSLVTGIESITMSVGEASFPEDGTEAEQLLAVADRQMYRAKQEARHRRAPVPLEEHAPAVMTVQ